MSLPTVTITRLANQLSRQGADAGEGVAAIVMGGVAVTGGAQLNTVYKLFSTTGAESIGLDAAYDTTNLVAVYHHISEFFRLNPTGELHIMLVAQNTSLEDMCDVSNDYLAKVLRDGQGRIRKAGVVLNPDNTYTSTTSGGLDADVLAAIPNAQALADFEFSKSRPVNNIVIEGREFNGTVGDATDLRSLAGGPYRDVSVVIGQDFDFAESNAIYNDMAAVGAYLGLATNKTPSQSFAQPISDFNLTDTSLSRFLSAYLSNHLPLGNLSDNDISALHDKGYVFTRAFANYDGIYFNQSHVCAPATDDYNASELRDVMNRAVRLTRPVLVPYINSTDFRVVDGTGRIIRQISASVEAELRQALESGMINDVSSFNFIIVDPEKDDLGQDYPSFLSDGVLRVLIGIIPKGKAQEITVSIGYTNG